MAKLELFSKKDTLVHDAQELAQKVAGALNSVIGDGTEDVLLFLAGGSALAVLPYLDYKKFGSRLTWSVLDERFSTDPKISNFLQISTTSFFKESLSHGTNFFSTMPNPGETQDELVVRWEHEIKEWVELHSHRKIIALMGIGDDGHIAGIMPYPNEEDEKWFSSTFESSNKWVVGYDAGAKNQYPLRVTVTLSFLKDFVDEAVVFVSGEKKRLVLSHIIKEPGKLTEYPARIVHLMKHVQVFTDVSIA